MNKLVFALAALIMIVASLQAVTVLKMNSNLKRIDKNFAIIKQVLDAQAKAITDLQPKKSEEVVTLVTPLADVKKAVDEGKAVIKN